MDTLVLFAMAAVGAYSRFLVDYQRSCLSLARTVFLSCVLCWFINQGLIAAEVNEGYRALICGTVAFMGRDILQALQVIGTQLKRDPLSLWEKFRGR